MTEKQPRQYKAPEMTGIGSKEQRASRRRDEADHDVRQKLAAEQAGVRALEEVQRKFNLVRSIPHLFDRDSFNLILTDLHNLQDTETKEIQIGEHFYPISELYRIITEIKRFSLEQQALPLEQKASTAVIDSYLANMGVTRGKISPQSTQGFRDCMKACIQSGNQTIIIRPQKKAA